MCSGGHQVVSMVAFYFNSRSSVPAQIYNFFVKLFLKRTKRGSVILPKETLTLTLTEGNV